MKASCSDPEFVCLLLRALGVLYGIMGVLTPSVHIQDSVGIVSDTEVRSGFVDDGAWPVLPVHLLMIVLESVDYEGVHLSRRGDLRMT